MASDEAHGPIYANRARARLESGDVAFGLGVQQLRSPSAAALARQCGFDFLFVDLEHAPLSHAMATDLAAACLPLGIPAIVRVPGRNSPDIAKLLDGGAQGIVVPHVDTAAEARSVVDACKYPPLGRRSFLGLQPHFGYRVLPPAQAMALANDEIIAVVMLESPQAIANAGEIAALTGIDVLMIGCNDLSLELGVPGELDHPQMRAACAQVVEACKLHGKTPGLGGIADATLLRTRIADGMRFILASNDTDLLLAAGQARLKSLSQRQE